MKNVTDKKVIDTWARPVLGLEAQSKHMRCKNDILYYDGQPIARHYNSGIVLVSAWSENGHKQFDPHLVSKQIGLPVDEVERLRSKVLSASGDDTDYWWCLPRKYESVVQAVENHGTTCYVVPNCLESPSQRMIESAVNQVKKRLIKAKRCSASYSIERLVEAYKPTAGYRCFWMDLSAQYMVDKTKELAAIFSLDASAFDELKPLFDECRSRMAMYHHGGPFVIRKFIKDHQLSKHTPVEVVAELMQRPEFERNYDGEYKQDLMVRQIAASEARAIYGAKGDRKKSK